MATRNASDKALFIFSSPTSHNNERLPATALDLELSRHPMHCDKWFIYISLDLAEPDIKKKWLKKCDENFRVLTEECLDKQITEFEERYILNSQTSNFPSYLNKLVQIYNKPFNRGNSPRVCHMFSALMNKMYNEKVNNGYLLMAFLKYARKEMTNFEGCLCTHIPAKILNFMIINIIRHVRETDPCSYKDIQNILRVSIFFLPRDFERLKVLLKYGHEYVWNGKDLSSNVKAAWQNFFQQSFNTVKKRVVEKYSLKRMFLLLQLYALFKEQDISLRNNFKNVVLQLWKAINMPFVTSGEIKEFLLPLVPEAYVNNVKLFCKSFENEFGNNILRPRSLQHISRCVIRQEINKKAMLPEGIDDLPLRPLLKEYLRLER